MMKKIFFCLLILLSTVQLLLSQDFVLHFEAQKISKSIRQVVKKMAAFEELHSSVVGYAGQKTEQYRCFEHLLQQATMEELVELCEHTAPCVRVYAFWGLAKKEYDQLETVFMAHAADSEPVLGIEGCFPMKLPVIDWMTRIVEPQRFDIECKKLNETTLAQMALRRKMITRARTEKE